MKKQGFTLIELMVVVVIIGILAAVAVPKLFGMIAKSKASEVGPAAGTYVKLQQAYVSEAAAYGSWKLIGYTAPGDNGSTTNFEFTAKALGGDDDSATAATNDVWTAKNKTKLNDCVSAEKNWTISTGAIGSAGQDTYTATVASVECKALTPTFDKIGK